MRIGVFDSGLGGLTVVKSILHTVKGADIHYVADTAHAPYGEKSVEDIRRFSRNITQTLIKRFGIDALVVACNTATTAAIADLRQAYPDLIIVGTEPGIKPAAHRTQSGVVGVLATPATLKSPKYRELAKALSQEHRIAIVEQACPGLVEQIEAGKTDDPSTETMLRRWLAPINAKGADTIVLGCTHYPLVGPLIRKLSDKEVTLIDTGDAIARRLASLLGETKDTHHDSTLTLYATGNIETNAVKSILGFLPPIKPFNPH